MVTHKTISFPVLPPLDPQPLLDSSAVLCRNNLQSLVIGANYWGGVNTRRAIYHTLHFWKYLFIQQLLQKNSKKMGFCGSKLLVH